MNIIIVLHSYSKRIYFSLLQKQWYDLDSPQIVCWKETEGENRSDFLQRATGRQIRRWSGCSSCQEQSEGLCQSGEGEHRNSWGSDKNYTMGRKIGRVLLLRCRTEKVSWESNSWDHFWNQQTASISSTTLRFGSGLEPLERGERKKSSKQTTGRSMAASWKFFRSSTLLKICRVKQDTSNAQ